MSFMLILKSLITKGKILLVLITICTFFAFSFNLDNFEYHREELDNLTENVNNMYLTNTFYTDSMAGYPTDVVEEKIKVLNDNGFAVSGVYERVEAEDANVFIVDVSFKAIFEKYGLINIKNKDGNYIQSRKKAQISSLTTSMYTDQKALPIGKCSKNFKIASYQEFDCNKDMILFLNSKEMIEIKGSTISNDIEMLSGYIISPLDEANNLAKLQSYFKGTKIEFKQLEEGISAQSLSSLNEFISFSKSKIITGVLILLLAITLGSTILIIINKKTITVLKLVGKTDLKVKLALITISIMIGFVAILFISTPLITRLIYFMIYILLVFLSIPIVYKFFISKTKRNGRTLIRREMKMIFLFIFSMNFLIVSYVLIAAEEDVFNLKQTSFMHDNYVGAVFVGEGYKSLPDIIDSFESSRTNFTAYTLPIDGEIFIYSTNYKGPLDITFKDGLLSEEVILNGYNYKNFNMENNYEQVFFETDVSVSEATDLLMKCKVGIVGGGEKSSPIQGLLTIGGLAITCNIIFMLIVISLLKRDIFVLSLLGKKTITVTNYIYGKILTLLLVSTIPIVILKTTTILEIYQFHSYMETSVLDLITLIVATIFTLLVCLYIISYFILSYKQLIKLKE